MGSNPARKALVWLLVWRPFGNILACKRYTLRLIMNDIPWVECVTAKASIIDAFGTFLLLAYSKLAITSIMLLTPSNLITRSGKLVGKVLLYDGTSRILWRKTCSFSNIRYRGSRGLYSSSSYCTNYVPIPVCSEVSQSISTQPSCFGCIHGCFSGLLQGWY